MEDSNPRPLKRIRVNAVNDSGISMQSPSRSPSKHAILSENSFASSALSSPPSSPVRAIRRIPDEHLLLGLPSILIHPPNHQHHAQSLALSLTALRKCLAIRALNPDIECRAWCGLAEVAMTVVAGGFSEDQQKHPWAYGAASEAENAISKGLLLAQKHPSLRPYRHRLTLMSAKLSQWQQNTKFARAQLKKLVAQFVPSSDPPHAVYAAHLALIDALMTPIIAKAPPPASETHQTRSKGKEKQSVVAKSSTRVARGRPSRTPEAEVSTSSTNASTPNTPSRSRTVTNIHAALDAVQKMLDLARPKPNAPHPFDSPAISLLAHVLRARILVSSGMWDMVGQALDEVEGVLGLSYEDTPLPKTSTPGPKTQPLATSTPNKATNEPNQIEQYIAFEDPFEFVMTIHTLILGVTYWTYFGNGTASNNRLNHLHALLDSGALDNVSDGTVEIPFELSPPLVLQTTHPRILTLLTYLVSASAKRDPGGRKPKRKIFASAGYNTAKTPVDLQLSTWSNYGDVEEINEREEKIKADLLCELVGISILRNELDVAEETLALLISDTRNAGLFELFSARITLHYAHLAHALGQTSRAFQCYSVAASMSEEGDFINVSARAGEVALKIGLATVEEGVRNPVSSKTRTPVKSGKTPSTPTKTHAALPPILVDDETRQAGLRVAELCHGTGGTLGTVGYLIESCLAEEILTDKEQLRYALDHTGLAGDNHLRSLAMAFSASHYFHTGTDHSFRMLKAADQLAASFGAGKTQAENTVGNAHMRLWVGERLLELYKRSGLEQDVKKQRSMNVHFGKAVDQLTARADNQS